MFNATSKRSPAPKEKVSNVQTASTTDMSYYSEKIKRLKEENSKLRSLLTEAEETFKTKLDIIKKENE